MGLLVAGSRIRKPNRPSESARISSAGGGLSRPASATTTTLNSSPFAEWIVSSRTASAPSSSETASRSVEPSASCCRTNRTKPSMSGPRSSS